MNSSYPASFTSVCTGLADKLVNEVTVMANGKSEDVLAIWDTGANISCVSKLVAEKLGLESCGCTDIKTPSGHEIFSEYCVVVRLPNNMSTGMIKVCESEIGNQEVCMLLNGVITKRPIGMLIGMDIISKGDFAVTNLNGKTKFTFRAPSFADIDFVQMGRNMSPARNTDKTRPNDQCPCGSGKKYKNCCGKVR